MRRPRHSYFVDKAIEAAISAIEVYNKPAFRYREETFSILMLNAWELILKARILKENKNALRSIEVWERRRPVTISEEDARKAFPWTYSDLRQSLRARYDDFKENDKFHKIRRPLEKDTRYCHVRLLDPKNAKTQKQRFYNPNIVAIFDEQYRLKTTARTKQAPQSSPARSGGAPSPAP